MSQFYQLLEKRGISKHDARALWKYSLSDGEFQRLKAALMSVKGLNSLDPRDCALYYAEWWKRCYEGGYPSKKEVFESVRNAQYFDAEDFFKHARKGAVLLGIRWTRHIHTLYFKTLLQQGGLPILHIRKNNNIYKTFLLKILALRPRTIDDFAFDTALTSILPLSSRNDQVYECCLAIVQAILNDGKGIGDTGVLTLLEQTAELTEIVKALRTEKNKGTERKALRKLRANWVLEPEKKRIRLYMSIPDLRMRELLSLCGEENIDAGFGSPEYRLFYNDTLLCKLVRRGDDSYRPLWISQEYLVWKDLGAIPEIYLLDLEGNRYDCPDIMPFVPQLDKPTLWSQYSEKEFLLQRGNNTDEPSAYLMGPESCNLIDCEGTELMEVNGTCLYWTKFEGEQVVQQNENHYCFRTHCTSFHWSIAEDCPSWLRNANMKIVRRKPTVYVSDKDGKPIRSVLSWKQPGKEYWQTAEGTMPLGIVHLRIEAGEAIEYDKCYNIGAFDIAFRNQHLQEASVVLRNEGFSFAFTESEELFESEQVQPDLFYVRLSKSNVFPTTIGCTLNMPGQRPLRFGVCSPFRGIEIVDNEQRILSPEENLSVSKLYGYRILTNEQSVVVRLRNSSNPIVTSVHKISQRVTPLRFFEDKMNQLLRLSKPGVPAIIEVEICITKNNKERIHHTYQISKYEGRLTIEKQEGDRIVIKNSITNSSLLAVPLNALTDSFEIQALESSPEGWSLLPENGASKYLVFSSAQEEVAIQPAFVAFQKESDVTEDVLEGEDLPASKTAKEEASQRMLQMRDLLLQSKFEDIIWKQLLSYYQICLDHGIAFSSFEILRCIAASSELVAKVFVYLLCYSSEREFDEAIQKRLEDELGICFHWIPKKDWGEAIEWIGCFGDKELMPLIMRSINSHFKNLIPAPYFETIANYILKEQTVDTPDFHLNAAVQDLRTSLGEQVLNALPREHPSIAIEFKSLIPVSTSTHPIKVLLKAPVSVALSIAGKESVLWHPHGEKVRRSVQYCYQLNPQWYAQAICYCLSRF